MFESEIMKDTRVNGYIVLDNGLISITIKPEYVNPEFGVSSFETVPAISSFLSNMDQYALTA